MEVGTYEFLQEVDHHCHHLHHQDHAFLQAWVACTFVMQIDVVANSSSPSKPKTCCPNSIATRKVEPKEKQGKKSNLKILNDMLHICGYKLRSRTRELGGEQVSKMTCMTLGL
jgi:hypothetical protein